MCWCSCRMEDQGRPSSGRRVLAQAKSSSSPLRDKLDFQFRFGVPLEQLPCLYLGDCGYVPAFLEDAGKVIKKNIDCEGLFRKSGDLRRQNVLKSQVEQGCSLSECDVHDVTSLVKFFFRLLPEPLVPCLFHDPLLACLNITHHDRRVEAVQGLCFSLPAHHLSSLRYFMRLLAHVAAMSVVNRMTARNLAVVLTPSLIRMKSRSKLMTEEELRALPRQTALVEHLICHAATIGVMTSRMFHGSLRLLEDMSSKLKAKKKKKNEAQRKILEKQLESEKLLLFFIADLGFRPNSCHSVPDTQVMSVPNARISFVPRKKQRSPSNCTRSCGQSLSNTCKNKKYVKRVCAVDQRTKPTITYFRKNTKNLDEDLFPFGWKIGPSLLESWSNAIPVN
ncbi:rho GTPase-activating protein 27-like isoform X2 [Pomacea canaliculata]|uniref:rho GTPase-activating protein 27-like isoform X2 n=1 Tax=Pomacea canaliculata TaxID=400727 RepID=UPI000D7384A6|nr:rho GTPase-activating protein 27-like isoform X2 [Pomacea canaliculata]